MQKQNVVLSFIVLTLATAIGGGANVFAQGFGDYVAPQTNTRQATRTIAPTPGQATPNTVAPRGVAPTPTPSTQLAPAQKIVQQAPQTVAPTVQSQTVPAPNVATPPAQQRQVVNPQPTQGGYLANEEIKNAYVEPPKNYNPTPEEQAQLEEFLKRWENFGKGIKRVSCNVHMREFDSVLQQDAKRPVAHTWGQFRFISPNKLEYHVKGEFSYSDKTPEGEWKEGQNELKLVLDGKSFTQYDFKNKKVVVFPIADEEQGLDLTMDNGQFPLFFIAKADVLKSRFYLRLITPEAKQKSEVWVEAFPRYARDAQQFQSIVVMLSLKDLQPTYMRKIGVTGKSKTDLTFEKVAVNKGVWTIEGSVEPGWTKDVREEKFSILQQNTVVTENGVVATVVSDPSQIPSSKKAPTAKTAAPTARQARTANVPQQRATAKRY